MFKELLPGLRRPAFRLTLLLFLLLGLYCACLAERNLGYLQELEDLSIIEEASFPPAVNAALLFSFLTGSTLFIMRGYLDLVTDRRNGTWRERLLLHGEKYLVFSRLFVLAAELCLCFIPVITISLLVQGKINAQIPGQSWQSLPAHSLISAGILKLLSGCLVLSVSYFFGIMTALILPHPAAGVLVCLAADQFLLTQSPLYTFCLYDAFQDAAFIVSVPESTAPSGNPTLLKILTGSAFLALSMTAVICIMKWGRRGYET